MPKKKAAESKENVECQSNGSSESSGGVGQEILVDFEARTATDEDIPGIVILLKHIFPAKVDVQELANYIVTHNHVGCVIKSVYEPMDDDVDDDDDESDDGNQVYGVTTVINISQAVSESKPRCLLEVHQTFSEACSSSGDSELKEFWSNLLAKRRTDAAGEMGNVGLLISERFLHIPPRIAPPLYNSLKSDMKEAVAKGMQSYNFDHYILIAKTFMSTDPKEEEITFGKAEEEMFAQECTHQFKYKVKKAEAEADDLDTYNTILIMSSKQFDKALERIENALK